VVREFLCQVTEIVLYNAKANLSYNNLTDLTRETVKFKTIYLFVDMLTILITKIS